VTLSTNRESASAPLARGFQWFAAIEPPELGAVWLSMLCFFLLFGSYSVVKPVRDAMGTVYGMSHIQELFTGTFLVSFIFAPLYSGLASRIRLSIFLPSVYGFVAISILVFYILFSASGDHQDRSIAAAFYVWVSTFNILIISVFWSFMADTFSRTQAKRLFGFIAAGATLGGIAGPAIATVCAKAVGNNGLMLISAAGFLLTAGLVTRLTKVKERLRALAQTDSSTGASAVEAQRSTLGRALAGSAFDGFRLLLKSPYLLLLAVFLLLMTWISTIVYIQLGDLISHAFTSRESRTQAFATIDLAVNSLAVVIQLLGTGRFIQRFGVTTGLLLNPVIMVIAFVAVMFSPVLLVLGGIQVLRRVAEYAVAKPTREMLFTVVDQESRYKAKNVIDTVIYRFGDVSSAWISSWILPFGVAGLAVFGLIVAALWFPVAYALGRRYDRAKEDAGGDKVTNAAI
jgi:ATP:ADP antiporter, AAA family